MTGNISFFDRSAQAYINKVFDCNSKVKDALVHKNYLVSPTNIQESALNLLNSRDTKGLPDVAIYPDVGDLCLGDAMQENKPEYVYWIGRAKKVLGDNHFNSALFDTEKFLDWLNSGTNRNLLWISDFRDNEGISIIEPSSENISDVLADLGLYGQYYYSSEEIILVELEVQSIFKPTLLDSGFTFYWQSKKENTCWGLTRSLRTGLPTLREWVVKKSIQDNLKVKSAQIIRCQDNIELKGELISNVYWEECKRELLAHQI